MTCKERITNEMPINIVRILDQRIPYWVIDMDESVRDGIMCISWAGTEFSEVDAVGFKPNDRNSNCWSILHKLLK